MFLFMKEFTLFSNPKELYQQMIKDILNAKKRVYLETYIYDDDKIGRAFRRALGKKAKEGVEVKLLLDAWGSTAKKHFFSEIISLGGEVRYFRQLRYLLWVIKKNHERNHRKLLVVDNNIAYVGSTNITSSCLNWRELSIRMTGGIANHFTASFLKSWGLHTTYIAERIENTLHKGFEIMHDVPAYKHRITELKYIELIDHAKKSILIETPYFVPSEKIIIAFYRAIRRGVRVIIVVPYLSDVRVVDIARNIYFGELFERGVILKYYKKKTLHSKLLIVDDDFFLLGSSNVDYRSFIHQYEINLLGIDKELISRLKEHYRETLNGCIDFNYTEWRSRSKFKIVLERIVNWFERYL
jgi:cardiolipin synthase